MGSSTDVRRRAWCTPSFYDGALAALRPGGVMVANFMSDDKRIDVYCRRIEESFGRGPTLLPPRGGQLYRSPSQRAASHRLG